MKIMAASSSQNGGAFDGDQAHLTEDIRGMVPAGEPGNDGDASGEEDEETGKRSRDSNGKVIDGTPNKKPTKVWTNRDEKVADTIRKQEEQVADLRLKATQTLKVLDDTISCVPSDLANKIVNDMKLASTRSLGLRRVLATDNEAEQKEVSVAEQQKSGEENIEEKQKARKQKKEQEQLLQQNVEKLNDEKAKKGQREEE